MNGVVPGRPVRCYAKEIVSVLVIQKNGKNLVEYGVSYIVNFILKFSAKLEHAYAQTKHYC